MDVFNGLTEPCWIIDILPARVPASSDGQYFAVERYYLEETRLSELRKKQLDLMLKLCCYEAVAADFVGDDAWEKTPSPERFAERFGSMQPGESFRFKVEAEDTLIAVNGDDLYMTMHHPSARMLKLVRALAHAEGLFVWKPEE